MTRWKIMFSGVGGVLWGLESEEEKKKKKRRKREEEEKDLI